VESKEQRESAPDTTELARKIVRLEKLVEKVLAEDELIGMYMNQLLDIQDRYWSKNEDYRWQHRGEIKTKIDIFRGVLENLEKEWQEHFKHHSYTDKKTNKDSNYIYSSIKEDNPDEKLHSD